MPKVQQPHKPQTIFHKIPVDYTFTHVYENYKEKIIPELQVSKKLHRAILKDFAKKARNSILLEGRSLILPYIGELRIKKIKGSSDPKKLKIDFNLSRKLGIKIYHLNEHRDGYFYRWSWDKMPFRNKKLRSFLACRQNTRDLGSLLKKYDKSQLDYPE